MILDTSVLIDIDRGINEDKLQRLNKEGPHKISAVTRTEFFTGVHKRSDTREEKARKLLDQAQEIPLEEEIAERAGELLARKQSNDLSIGLNDIYITATAIHEDEAVLTRDAEDFNEIEELEVKNWEDF